jgi:hypothetical protein
LSHSYRHVLSSHQFEFDATILSNPTHPRQPRSAFAPPYIGLFGCTLLSESLPTDNAMSSEATRHAPMMPLRKLVDRYLTAAGSFGIPAALASFALSDAETERLFSSYDEDYHISRFFHFSQDAGAHYSINGFPATHVAIDSEIQSIL